MAQSSLGSGFFVDSDLSPDGGLLATCWSDPIAYVFNIQQRELVLELARHTGSVACIRFSRDGKRLITASKDGTAIVWPVNVDEEARQRMPGSRDELLRYFGMSLEDVLPAGARMPSAQQ
jgi:WD40 repeat protein